MAESDLSKLRVMVVGAKGHAGPIMRTVMTAAGISRLIMIEDPRRALDLLCTDPFDAVFVEGSTMLDGMPFAISARRSEALLNPLIPVFAVYGSARRRDVERERDLGVHDVICRPVSPKTIAEKLRAALVAPRPFIAAPDFFGPDRRAKARPWRGADRRSRQPKKTKINLDAR